MKQKILYASPEVMERRIEVLENQRRELLEALKAVTHCNDYATGSLSFEFKEALKQVQDAISKAGGREV